MRSASKTMLTDRTRQRNPLLHKYSVCDSGNVDALSAAVVPYFGQVVVQPERGSKDFRAQLNICRLQKTAVCYGSFEHPFSVEVADSASFAHGFPIRGAAEHVSNGMVVPDLPHKGAIGGPGALSLHYGRDFELFSIFMRPRALCDTLSGLIGAPLSGELRLDESNYHSRPEPRMVRSLVRLLIAELDHQSADLSPLVLAELEQAILVAFLCGASHNYSRLLDGRPRDAAPWQVRRSEEYIEANWSQPISLEALAVFANASGRSIFQSFKKHRGYTPMSFLKQVRLRHAREMLTKPNSDTSVTSVSFACGFGNLGHFANDYHQVFGETPSSTLNHAKGSGEPSGARAASPPRLKVCAVRSPAG
jgi:AraC-like DNA-binding protein